MQHAEHGKIGPDGDGQCNYHGEGKTRSFMKLANRVTKIVPEIGQFIHLVQQV